MLSQMCEHLFLHSILCVKTVVMSMANNFQSPVLVMFPFHPMAVTNTITESNFKGRKGLFQLCSKGNQDRNLKSDLLAFPREGIHSQRSTVVMWDVLLCMCCFF